MKEIKNVTLYKCDHCGKKLQRKHAMVNHEAKCRSNPNNIKACFDCEYIDRVAIEYYSDFEWDDGPCQSTAFMCTKKGVFMYPPKLEHSARGIPDITTYKGNEITQESMPIECDYFKLDTRPYRTNKQTNN